MDDPDSLKQVGEIATHGGGMAGGGILAWFIAKFSVQKDMDELKRRVTVLEARDEQFKSDRESFKEFRLELKVEIKELKTELQKLYTLLAEGKIT